MEPESNFVVCGMDIAELKPSAELRYEARWFPISPRDPNTCEMRPVLQQKWVARAKMPDGGMWEEHRWRDVPTTFPNGEQA